MHTVQVIAHRGASGYAPENTIAAFNMALRMGADALETDVRATRDGVLVLCHDATVDSVSNGTGELTARTFSELRRLDFGTWFGPLFTGERLVTVDEFLRCYDDQCGLVLEIKSQGVEEQLLSLVKRQRLLSRVVFTSYSLGSLEIVSKLESRARIGFLVHQFDDATIRLVQNRGFEQICPPGEIVTPALVEQAHAAGLMVRAWGIHSAEVQDCALRARVDGMTTNWPDKLIARLKTLEWR